MGVNDELLPLLYRPRLRGVLQSLELRLCEAADDNLSYDEFLYRLMKRGMLVERFERASARREGRGQESHRPSTRASKHVAGATTSCMRRAGLPEAAPRQSRAQNDKKLACLP